MNHDDKNPDMQTWIEPGLEARVVAWVSGEASAFEAAELERVVNEKPELAIFKRRIEAVRGLVAEALRPDPQPLLLSPERRAKLLQAIGGPANSAASQKAGAPIVLPLAYARRRDRMDWRWMLAAAAGLAVVFFLTMSVPSFQKVRSLNVEFPGEKAKARGMLLTNSDGEMAVTDVGAHAHQQVVDREFAMKAAVETAEKRKEEFKARERTRGMAGTLAQLEPGSGLLRAELKQSSGNIGSLSAPGPAKEEGDFEKMEVTPAFTFNQGYVASNTLAGTRIRTDLSDVASAISVTTKQFLQDTAAASAKDQLDYAANTEVAGVQGNFAARRETGSSDADEVNPSQVAVSLDASVSTGAATDGAVVPQFPDMKLTSGVPPAATPIQAAAARQSDEQVILLSPFEVKKSAGAGGKASAKTWGLGGARTPAIPAKFGEAKAGSGEPASPPAPANVPPAEIEVAEVNAATDPVSTFSLHVSDVSFRLAQAALARGEKPDEERIRPEEFYNAFHYSDPAPAMSEKIGCRVEQAAHPMLQQRNLVRIAMQVAATGRGAGQPLRLTVLLDTSGSMERADRAAAVRRAMEVLTSLLGPNDRVTLIGFARQPSLLAEQVPGDKAGQLLDIIARTPAEGGTNLDEALKLGGEIARRHQEATAQNRLVLLTDGAANLGNADPAQLGRAVETLRQQGISFDACGVGNSGIDDAVLEALTRKGGGRYYVLDSPEAADAGFARQLAGAFRPAAENVKVQVRFNPARVGNYRLIGFERHRLNEADFRNDRVQAAELAAEEAAVALYQVEVRPDGEGELGEVYVRFRDVATGAMVERSWTLAFDPRAPAFDRATPAMQLTGASALLAEKLRGGDAGDEINLKDLAGVMNTLRGHYAQEVRVQELVTMFNQARKLSGE